MESELQNIRIKVEEIQQQMNRKIQEAFPEEDMSGVQRQLADIEEKLSEKANKQSVAQALHRKANRTDIDAVLA
jgi:hypothetical protein